MLNITGKMHSKLKYTLTYFAHTFFAMFARDRNGFLELVEAPHL
jgi:hypothetical protein